MKKKQKDAFEIKLERETRKLLIKDIIPLLIAIYGFCFFVFAVAGKETGLGIIGWLRSQMPISITFLVLCVLMIPFLWFMQKPICEKQAFKKLFKGVSKTLVEKVMTPGEPVRVNLFKSESRHDNYILGLQRDGKTELYAVLGEKDNLVAIYAIQDGEVEKRDFDVVSTEEFTDYYNFVEDSENSQI